jgi:beta-lactamase class A
MIHTPASAREAMPLLIESADPELQIKLEELVINEGLTSATEQHKLALALVVVTDPDRPRLAEINGHEMIYAASLPKIAILLGAAVELEEGRLSLDETLQQDLNNMIRHSCNACATRVLEQVGRKQLLRTLQAPEYRFYDPDSDGGLWVGKDYGPSSAYQRDPLANLSHGATAFQAARFYYKLNTETLVSETQSKLMLSTLVNPGISHKFVKGLEPYDGLEIYRKSGTWRNFHADSALVRVNGMAYIMIALAHDPKGTMWMQRLAGPLHELAISAHEKTTQPDG